MATVVPIFDGKPGDFRNWVKAIEKYIILSRLGEKDTKAIAYQRSSGVVSDFVGRDIQSQGKEPWEDLKTQLKARSGEISHPHPAFASLQKCKQRKNETVALYAERLCALAEESFPNKIATAGRFFSRWKPLPCCRLSMLGLLQQAQLLERG